VTGHRSGSRASSWRLSGRAVALALGLALVQVVGSNFAAHAQEGRRSLDAVAFVLLLAGPVALLWLRRRPPLVLAAVLAVTLAYLLAGYPYGPVLLSPLVALVATSVLGHRAAAIAGAVVLYAGMFAVPAIFDLRYDEPGGGLAWAAWLVVALLLAEWIRVRRTRRIEAARAREEEERRRASEERLGIARELHDVLAHSISLINVQASTALHLIDEQPERARDALAAIKRASKDALDEVRSVVGVLRRADEQAPRSPAAGLGRLDELVASTAAAGLDVRARTEGTPRPLPAGVDAAAFRIVQEALTNVTRHAGDASAAVAVVYGDGELTVSVEDDGRGAGPDAADGNGLRGMRERAEALGGWLEAGPREAGGFRVLARLPTGPEGAGGGGEAP
jgi:signal transduction histidine kinase